MEFPWPEAVARAAICSALRQEGDQGRFICKSSSVTIWLTLSCVYYHSVLFLFFYLFFQAWIKRVTATWLEFYKL